ncbi:MAG: hypothetical protein NTU57_00390 [Candidatus Aenigmarchaeota archaeon]|nr:hypothetical protein [Candidatus Aenigmarchaeota archaeon]
MENGDNIAVSVEDLLETYSLMTRERVIKYPEIMKARQRGGRIIQIAKDMKLSPSSVGYYANETMSPTVYKMLKSCRWLPLRKSEDLDFIVNYTHDHGHIHNKLNMAKIWSADSFELNRLGRKLQKVFKKKFPIRKDRRIYVIYTDSLTARALHLLGVPVGRKMG